MNRKLIGVTAALCLVLLAGFSLTPMFRQSQVSESVQPVSNPMNTRLLEDKKFVIGNKDILQLKYEGVIKLWGKPLEIEKAEIHFPATVEPSYSYILHYDSIDIEMYPVDKDIPVENTESFRFDITDDKYDFYGVKTGITLDEYLNRVQNKQVFSVKEILADQTGERVPYQYQHLLVMAKKQDCYAKYDKAIYEQVVIAGIPYGAVMLFQNDILTRIVYGYPNAS